MLDTHGYVEKLLVERYGSSLHDEVKAARERLTAANCGVPGVEPRVRYAWIRQVVQGCVEKGEVPQTRWTDRLDHILTHKLWGTLVFLLLMLLVFTALFQWAQPLMDLISEGLAAFGGMVEGPIALQIHGGSERWQPAGYWRWRNVGIKELP